MSAAKKPALLVAAGLIALACCSGAAAATAQAGTPDVFEASIPDLQAAQAAGRISARQLVEHYLARIRAYDQAGPALNAMVTLNPKALQEADALDRERLQRGPRGPLHGIPVVIKDNFETEDMPTSAGTLALATFRSGRDAFQVARLRQAGAIVLGKTTLHELAAGITTVSSLTGATRNPYDLQRVPGGSSGGTAAAVAASFAAAGMGSDTCGSIRIPAANQNLVGLRVTRGLSSRSGIVPLSSTQDEAGPLARSVTDLALMLDATVAIDPQDPATLDPARTAPPSYAGALEAGTLRGKRIGVLVRLFGQSPEDAEMAGIVRKALERMKQEGAEIVEVSIPGLDELMQGGNVIAHEFKFVLADYLARHPGAPVRSLQDLIDRGLAHEQLDAVLRLRNATVARDSDAYRSALQAQATLRERMVAALRDERLDTIAYPVLRRKPALIGEAQAGFTCQLSANSGLPALSMPAGFTEDGVPVGMELLGGAYQEPALLQLARAWERLANLRRPPFSTPPLVGGAAPAPVEFQVRAGAAGEPHADAAFRYEPATGRLHYKVHAGGVEAADMVALTLQHGEAGKPGPVIVQLLRAGQTAGSAELALRARDRAALAQGRLYLHLYTQKMPLGVARARLQP